MIAEPIPEWLQCHVKRINSLEGVFPEGKKANHILVNEYLPGVGIMPHLDGPLFHPVISTISLGSHTVLDFYEPFDEKSEEPKTQFEERKSFSILVEPRSLLILSEDLYNKVSI